MFMSGPTLEGVDDAEDVVRWDGHGSVAEEGKAPGEAEHGEQPQDGEGVGGRGAFRLLGFQLLLQLNLSHHEDEDEQIEEKHQRVVADVYCIVNLDVRDPTPDIQEHCICTVLFNLSVMENLIFELQYWKLTCLLCFHHLHWWFAFYIYQGQ